MNAVTRNAFGLLAATPRAVAAAAAVLTAAPAVFVLLSLAAPYGDTIRHVASTLAARYAANTFLLTLLVGVVAGAAGVIAALLIALCEFPFRRVFSFALILPLAVPSYLAAYAYADFLGPFGALAGVAASLDAVGAPPIRSLPGAAFILSITLYPYVYLTARAAFAARSSALFDAARTIGVGPVKATYSLLAPAARPAIAAGVALVMMETISDFGVADYFGVPTLSVGVFRTWYSFGDLTAASQLASGLFLFALLLVGFEAAARRGRSAEAPRVTGQKTRFQLRGHAAIGAILFLFCLPALGFLAPVADMAMKASATHWAISSRGLSDAARDSAVVAVAGAGLTLFLAIGLAYAVRHSKGALTAALARVATLGYAIPGAVIAIGVLAVLHLLKSATGVATSGIVALLFAYCARFLTAGYGAVRGAMSAIDSKVDDAAATLGVGGVGTLAKVHFPLIRGSLLAAATILFVDIVKELPATLILRDFNFETLATRAYRLAGDERFSEAAPNALILVAISAAPIFLLNRLAEGTRQLSARTPRSDRKYSAPDPASDRDASAAR